MKTHLLGFVIAIAGSAWVASMSTACSSSSGASGADGGGSEGGQDASTADTGSSSGGSGSSSGSSSGVVAEGGGGSSSGSLVDSGGGSSSGSATDSGGGGGGCDSGLACPPSTVLAINTLAFGDGNSGQWAALGFNLDDKVTTAASTDVCQVNAGAAASTPYPDGNGGIDNSFGKNILPSLLGLDPTWVTDANGAIQQGSFTTLLDIAWLPPTGDAPVLSSTLFGGTALGATPKWDGTDMWPVEPDLLSNPADPQSSSLLFPGSSVTGTTFSAGKNGTFVIRIPMTLQSSTASIELTLHAAQLTMTLSGDRKSATGGVVGGVLNTEDLVAQIDNLGVAFGFCGSIITNLETAVRQASDILSDGTQDSTKTCDGISIGLGFTMLPVQIGVVGPAPAAAMSCP